MSQILFRPMPCIACRNARAFSANRAVRIEKYLTEILLVEANKENVVYRNIGFFFWEIVEDSLKQH